MQSNKIKRLVYFTTEKIFVAFLDLTVSWNLFRGFAIELCTPFGRPYPSQLCTPFARSHSPFDGCHLRLFARSLRPFAASRIQRLLHYFDRESFGCWNACQGVADGDCHGLSFFRGVCAFFEVETYVGVFHSRNNYSAAGTNAFTGVGHYVYGKFELHYVFGTASVAWDAYFNAV